MYRAARTRNRMKTARVATSNVPVIIILDDDEDLILSDKESMSEPSHSRTDRNGDSTASKDPPSRNKNFCGSSGGIPTYFHHREPFDKIRTAEEMHDRSPKAETSGGAEKVISDEGRGQADDRNWRKSPSADFVFSVSDSDEDSDLECISDPDIQTKLRAEWLEASKKRVGDPHPIPCTDPSVSADQKQQSGENRAPAGEKASNRTMEVCNLWKSGRFGEVDYSGPLDECQRAPGGETSPSLFNGATRAEDVGEAAVENGSHGFPAGEPGNGGDLSLVGGREELKGDVGFQEAEKEEWRRREEELKRQAAEVQKLKKRKKAEQERVAAMESRQRMRVLEIRSRQEAEEKQMGVKVELQSGIQKRLEKMADGCTDMAAVLRRLNIPLEGLPSPTEQQVQNAYKKALLRFHPDRLALYAKGDARLQVEGEEMFKLISKLKQTLPWLPKSPSISYSPFDVFGPPRRRPCR